MPRPCNETYFGSAATTEVDSTFHAVPERLDKIVVYEPMRERLEQCCSFSRETFKVHIQLTNRHLISWSWVSIMKLVSCGEMLKVSRRYAIRSHRATITLLSCPSPRLRDFRVALVTY